MQPKKLLYITIISIAIWLLLDTVLYFALARIDQKRHLFYKAKVPSQETIRLWSVIHDPVLGWDIGPIFKDKWGNRKAVPYTPKDTFKIKAFGDSFTYGMTGDLTTWPHELEKATGWDCLNFGMKAYGTDQAVMKYQRNNIPTRYTILAILDENIGRLMTHTWAWYNGQSHVMKPRFDLGMKRPELHPNPMPEMLDQTGYAHLLDSLQEDDYWHLYYTQQHGPETLQWPASLTIVRHFSFFSEYFGLLMKNTFNPDVQSIRANSKFYDLYYQDSDGIAILQQLVDEFVRIARQKQETPLIVIFPIRQTTDLIAQYDHKPYESLLIYLEATHLHYLDMGDTLAQENYEAYYIHGDGHFSAAGNQRVACSIQAWITDLEAQP